MKKEDLLQYQDKSLIIILKNQHKYTVIKILSISDKAVSFIDKFSASYTISLDDIMLIQERNEGDK